MSKAVDIGGRPGGSRCAYTKHKNSHSCDVCQDVANNIEYSTAGDVFDDIDDFTFCFCHGYDDE